MDKHIYFWILSSHNRIMGIEVRHGHKKGI